MHSGVITRLPETYGTRPAALLLLTKSWQVFTALEFRSSTVVLMKMNGCNASKR